jgi:hypothetical protein
MSAKTILDALSDQLEADKKEIDDKNVDHTELAALEQAKTVEYQARRQAAFQRRLQELASQQINI